MCLYEEGNNGVNDKQKEDFTTFLGGVVIMAMGMAALLLEKGWIVTITGVLFVLFGVGLVCVGWSSNNEKR